MSRGSTAGAITLAFGAQRLEHQRDEPLGGGRCHFAGPGVLEITGAAGLVLPHATGIAPWLTPLAAALLVLLMVFAAVFHLRRAGEGMSVATNLILCALAAFVAYGRLVLAPWE
jgi:hypothetical protein